MTRRAARIALVVVIWPLVAIADRLRGIDPPARWRDGWSWAAGSTGQTGSGQ